MKSLMALAAAVLLLAAGAAAQELPPPPIEPELAPGSRLVDARADALVRQMSERLAGVAAFALEAEEVYDEVPEHSPRRQLTSVRHVALKRPGRLAGDAGRRRREPSFWYDGTTFWALDKEQNVWTSGGCPTRSTGPSTGCSRRPARSSRSPTSCTRTRTRG